MNIDLDYAKLILGCFVESSQTYLFSDEILLPSDDLEKYVFHIGLFSDLGLLANMSGGTDMKSLGIKQDLDGTFYRWGVQIRLTAKGHEFYKTLCSSEVLERLKSDFKDAPFEVMYNVGRQLMEHIFNKKLGQILD